MQSPALPDATDCLPDALVLNGSEASLGSPIPTLFPATTRNSYSTQGLNPTTVALRVFPPRVSGTETRGARQRMARRRVNTADESIEQMRCVLGNHPGHRTLVPLTRGHSLPTHGKRRPSLNGKHLNGAVVVRAWPPA